MMSAMIRYLDHWSTVETIFVYDSLLINILLRSRIWANDNASRSFKSCGTDERRVPELENHSSSTYFSGVPCTFGKMK
ncbi:hypothetical protein TNCV_4140371 [Trichonephila clavipes]|nr:hypothetical protein TNCV_4140371 [Trichonephila clavipes]